MGMGGGIMLIKGDVLVVSEGRKLSCIYLQLYLQ